MQSRVRMKIEQIARLRVAGIKDGRIAEMLGMSPPGLARILALQEYKAAEDAVLSGTITKMDEALAGKADEIRKMYAVGVPAAMRALLDAVTQRRDLRCAVTAATEMLDRDPDRTFQKQKDVPAGADEYNEKALLSAMESADKVAKEVKNNLKQRVN